MNRTNPDIDIVAYVLEEVMKARPDDVFCKSIRHQYIERGGLSKKQLEGLFGKAQRIPGIHPGRLATLEAIIKKKHTTHRSQITVAEEAAEKDLVSGQMIDEILAKYPQHKAILFINASYQKQQQLTAAEKAELQRFYKLLMKKPAP